MMTELEGFFKTFRENTIGNDQTFVSPLGKKRILYADWVASARFYQPIEDKIAEEILPYAANTHTETTVTGTRMTKAYEASKKIIKKHVNASKADKIIFCGSGMTAAIAKLQRILGLKIPERFETYLDGVKSEKIGRSLLKRRENQRKKFHFKENHKPIVFVTHMEHHSNHTSWLETICDVEIIDADQQGQVCLKHFRSLCDQHKDRLYKIASVTACSNVTGIETPYHDIAKIIHEYNGLCFVDFAASAPYVNMNMHPDDEDAYLDAIFFSPHKFLGGPGTPGVLIFNEALYNNRCPDVPGGGTVSFTTPWYMHDYIDDIEAREDGGTPPFIQGIRAAMVIKLKEQMGVDNIKARKDELLNQFYDRIDQIDGIRILADNIRNRHGVVSITIDGMHYNLMTKVLNDQYGIQVRGGCVCAGTYGHYLLDLDQKFSNKIRKKILNGDNSFKPGFVRVSLHPTLSDEELNYILEALETIYMQKDYWQSQYSYQILKNEYIHNDFLNAEVEDDIESIFDFNSKEELELV